MADSRSAKEGNFGIGKRWLTDNQKFIFGVYGFYDRRRTELSNIVNQITLGFEAISNTWDYRANFYYPQNTIKEVEKSRKILDTKSWREFVGNNEYIMTQNSIKTLKIKEVPLKGLDLEIGSVVPGVKSLRLYGAYYYFQGRANAKSINGFRIRSNFQLNDNFSVLLEGSRDSVRKTNGFVGFQFKVELGEKRKKTNTLSSLEKRMVELPERDIDIVTNESALTTGISSSLTKELKSTNNYFIEQKDSSGKAPSTTYGLYENPYNLKQKNQLKPLKDKLKENKGKGKWFIVKNGKIVNEVSADDLIQQLKDITYTPITPIKEQSNNQQQNINTTQSETNQPTLEKSIKQIVEQPKEVAAPILQTKKPAVEEPAPQSKTPIIEESASQVQDQSDILDVSHQELPAKQERDAEALRQREQQEREELQRQVMCQQISGQ